MAPVGVKRKRILAPLADGLRKVHKSVEECAGQPEQLLEALNAAGSTIWPSEKGDLFQWSSVLDVIDSELKKEDASRDLVLASLRFSRSLLENCSNRHVYNSYEHLQRLLEWNDWEVVLAVLRVLSVLATPRSTRQVVGEPQFVSRLTTLSTTWGGVSDGVLSLSTCCRSDVSQVLAQGTTVHMQIYKTAGDAEGSTKANSDESTEPEGLTIVHITKAHELEGTDEQIFEKVMKEYAIPSAHQFAVKTRLRLARAFPDTETRRNWVRVQITAATVLAHVQNTFGASSNSTPINEGQLADLIELLQDDATHPVPLDIQTLAVKSLTALLAERSRNSNVLLTASSASHHGILPSIMRKAKLLLNDHSGDYKEHLKFAEALLSFTWMFAGSPQGSTALSNAGIMHMIVPALADRDTRLSKLLTLAVKTLEVLMNYSQDMHQSFRDLDGVNTLVHRAYLEVKALSGAEVVDKAKDGSIESGESKPMDIGDGQGDESVNLEKDMEICRLLAAILHLLSSASTPVASSSDVRELATGDKLPFLLKTIFEKPERFGAAVYEKAAALLTEFVHQEPGCLQYMLSSGVAASFLASMEGNLPASRAVVNAIRKCTLAPLQSPTLYYGNVPFPWCDLHHAAATVLGALCLTPAGCALVDQAKPLTKLMSGLCSEKVVLYVQGNCPSNLGVQLEELMRHNPPLLDSCMAGCVQMADNIPIQMAQLADGDAAAASSASPPLTKQSYLLCAVEFLGKLLEPLMSAAEHSRVFHSKQGLDSLLRILALPDLPPNFARSEAGRFLVIVVGKIAFHSSSSVLNEVMQRTLKVLKSVKEHYSTERILQIASTGQDADAAAGKDLLQSLDLHTNLLSGIVGSFRGSSSGIEWEGAQGSELVQACAECYLVLRLAACAASRDDATIAKADLLKSDASGALGPAASASAGAAALLASDLNAIDAGVGAADAVVPDVPATEQDVQMQSSSSLAALLMRITNTLSAPQRRRGDDVATNSHLQEKAASVAQALCKLLDVDVGLLSSVSHLPTCLAEVLSTLSMCILGADDPTRQSRTTVNTTLLNAFVQKGGITRLASLLSWLVQRVIDGLPAASERRQRLLAARMTDASASDGAGGDQQKQQQQDVQQAAQGGDKMVVDAQQDPKSINSDPIFLVEAMLIKYFNFVGRLLTTTYTTTDRFGAQVAPPGFDNAKFVSNLRTVTLEAIDPLWKNPGLADCPSLLISAVLQLVKHLLKSDAPDPQMPALVADAGPTAPPPRPVDPRTVSALMEMGFEEHRVLQALNTIHSSSIEEATEWLFMNMNASDEDSEMAQALALSMQQEQAGASSASAPSSSAAQTDASSSTAAPAAPAPVIDEHEKRAKEVAEGVRSSLLAKCLDFTSAGDNTIDFAIVDALSLLCVDDKGSKQVIESLDTAICAAPLQGSGPLLPLTHVLAILLGEDADCRQAARDIGCLKKLTGMLQKANLSGGVVPAWVCSCLLAIHVLMQPVDATTKPPQQQSSSAGEGTGAPTSATGDTEMMMEESVDVGAAGSADDRFLLDFCISVLRSNYDAHLLQAVLQLCSRLTRVYSLALHFFHEGGLELLLAVPADKSFAGQAVLTGVIIRHVLEDEQTLQTAMQVEIKAIIGSFSTRNNASTPTLRNFLSISAALAQRNQAVFAKAVRATCTLQTTRDGRRLISLIEKKDDKAADKAGEGKEHGTTEGAASAADGLNKSVMSSATPSTKCKGHKKAVEVSGQVVSILIDRLVSLQHAKATSTDANTTPSKDKSADASAAAAAAAAGQDMMEAVSSTDVPEKKDNKDKEKGPDSEWAISRANLLRYLTELVKFYPGCAHQVVKSTLADRQDPSKHSAQHFVSFAMTELLPADSIGSGGSLGPEISRRTTALMLALFSRSAEARKKLLAEIVNILTQEKSPQCPMTQHLKVMHSLADVLLSMLTAKASISGQGPPQPMPELIKLMHESKVVNAVCSALDSIDLHHPSAQKVSTALLRPLDLLCGSVKQDARSQTSRSNARNAAERAEERAAAEGRDGEDMLDAMDRDRHEAEQLAQDDAAHDDMHGDVNASLIIEMEQHDEDGRDDRAQDMMAADGDSVEMREDDSEGDDESSASEESADDDEESHEDEGEENESDMPDLDEEGGEEDEEGEDIEEDDDEEEDDDPMHAAVEEELLGAGQRIYGELLEEGGVPDLGVDHEQDFDQLMQRIDNRYRPGSMMDMMQGGGEDDGHQVLSLLVPGGRSNSNSRFIQDMISDMQVVRFPGGRSGRGAIADARNLPTLLHEVPAAEHPLLLRRPEAGARAARSGSRNDPFSAQVNAFMTVDRSAGSITNLISQLGGGRFLLGMQGDQVAVANLPPEDPRGNIGASSRWTDDGSGLTAGMRGLALELEERLAAALAQQAQQQAQQSADNVLATELQSAPAAAAGPVDNPPSLVASPRLAMAAGREMESAPAAAAVDGGAAPVVQPSSSLLDAFRESVAAAAAASADVNTSMPFTSDLSAVSSAQDVSSSSMVVDEAETSLEAPSERVDAAQQAAAASAAEVQAGVVQQANDDAMDEDDELQAALQLSMQATAAALAQPQEMQQQSHAEGTTNATAATTASTSAPTATAGSGEQNQEAGARVPAESAGTQAGAGSAAGGMSSIDPSFLAELPEELRAEVMSQQQQHDAAMQMAAASSAHGIDPEFLAALPPDIQADVLRQHQRAQEAAAQPPADPSLSQDMDNASFIATLSPELREEVLLSADDAFLAGLPPHLAAEAALLRERAGDHFFLNRYSHFGAGSSVNARAAQPAHPVRPVGGGEVARTWLEAPEVAVKEKPKQVIEEDRVASIVRLVFLAQPINKTLMHRMLSHLCVHEPTRLKAVKMLLAAILHTDEPSQAAQALYGGNAAAGKEGPPLFVLSRRALEALNHVASVHPSVCELMLQPGFLEAPPSDRADKGKRAVNASTGAEAKTSPFEQLMRQLSRQLYMRSSQHLEQLSQLLHSSLQSVTSDAPPAVPQAAQAGSTDAPSTLQQGPFARSPNMPRTAHATYMGQSFTSPWDAGATTNTTPSGGHQTPGSSQSAGAAARQQEAADVQPSPSAATTAAAAAVSSAAASSASAADSTGGTAEGIAGSGGERAVGGSVGGLSVNTSMGTGSSKNQAKVPPISEDGMNSLTHAIAHMSSSPKAIERLTNLLKSLCASKQNLDACIKHLIREVRDVAQTTVIGLRTLADMTAGGNTDPESGLGYDDLKLLRLVRTLKSLWPDAMAQKDSEVSAVEGAASSSSATKRIMEDCSLADAVKQDELWDLLGQCLGLLEGTTEAGAKAAKPVFTALSPALSRLQPLVEACLVVTAPDTPPPATTVGLPLRSPHTSLASPTAHQQPARRDVGEASGSSAASDSGVLTPSERFVQFAERHRTTINMYIRQDKSLLSNLSFAPLVRYPKLLDFDNKKYYFRSELKRRNGNQRHGSIRLCVRRDYVFEDSFHQIVLRKPEELKGKLSVVFQGEEGVDAGGLTREWYLTLSRQMLNPDKALFIQMSNGLTYQPNPASHIQPDHLKYFKFAGQVVGKALWDEQLLDAHFTLSMYKHLLNLPIDYKDVEAVDPDHHRALHWLLENPINGVLFETFSVVRDQFGEVLTVDLKPNGRNIPLTDENKHEYVRLVAEQKLTKAIRDQIDAFKEGFHELMPPELISIFTCHELELLMCGLPTIDVEDLKANTEYSGYTRDSVQIQWYWSVVQALSQEDLARLVQFVTGTSQVPMEGFRALRGMNGPQRFNIHRCGDSRRLPSSHTCFNQLDLPEYSTEQQLQKSLLAAIREGFEGFGFS